MTALVLELRLMDDDGYPGAEAAVWDEEKQRWGWTNPDQGEWAGVAVVDAAHGQVVVSSTWADCIPIRLEPGDELSMIGSPVDRPEPREP